MAYLVMNYAFRIPGSTISAYIFSQTFCGTIAAVIILHEAIIPTKIVAVACIM
jgi:drug/metabolite transporter (DMT)-like permease